MNDTTSGIDIETFLATVFDGCELDKEIPILSKPAGDGFTSVVLHPDTVAKSMQPGMDPWYFCVSTVKMTPELQAGQAPARTRDDLYMIYCLVLDDIGTKVGEPPVAPSWVLESSQGNFQYGYLIDPILATPESIAHYEGCVAALGVAGYGDTGAGGSYRIMRVPGSLHLTKNDWISRVTQWNPERCWDLDELMEEFELEPLQQRPHTPRDPDFVPPPLEECDDPVLQWLDARGMYGGAMPGKPGAVQIQCPWQHEHSPGGAQWAMYSPKGHGEPQYAHGFNCLHGHCEGRSKHALLDWVRDQGGPDVRKKSFDGFPRLERQDLPDRVDTQGGAPAKVQLPTSDNLRYLVEAFGIEVRHNMMTHKDEYLHPEFEHNVKSHNVLALAVQDEMLRLGIPINKQYDSAMLVLAQDEAYHPVEDWIAKNLPWDGEDHIARLAATVTTDTELWPVYLRKYLIQVVAGVCGWRTGGQQLPHVLVFAGAHGLGKSRWFKNLLPAAFFKGEASLHLNTGGDAKDARLQALRTAITELSELETTFSKSETGALKAFLSTEEDEIRRVYAHHTTLMPRTTSYCGSVNNHDFLVDKTGNRRFWPVDVTAIAWEHDVDFAQLWAQAFTLWARGDTFYLDHDEQQLHETISEEHLASSVADEQFYKYFDDELMSSPKDTWVVMTTVDVFEVLDLKGNIHHPALKADMALLMTKLFGKARKIQGVQKARLMPVRSVDRQRVSHRPGGTGYVRKVPNIGPESEK